MRVIAARDIPVFFEAEASDRTDKDKLLRLMSSSSKGSLPDKLRLLAVLNLRAADETSASLLAELEEALRECYTDSSVDIQRELSCGLDGIKHMRQIQSFQQQVPHSGGMQADATSTPASGLGSWVQSKVKAQTRLLKSSCLSARLIAPSHL